MMTRIFQLVFLLHFLLLKPFSYITIWYQQPSGQEAFRNSCFTHEETRAQKKLCNFLRHMIKLFILPLSSCSDSCRGDTSVSYM